MVDYITEFFQANLYGIPVWFILIIVLIAFLFRLYLKGIKPKKEPFKKRDLKKEIGLDFKKEYKELGFKVNKRLNLGYTNIGFALKQINYKEMPKLTKIRNKLIYTKGENKKLVGFSLCKPNSISRAIALLGLRIRYVIIDEEYLTMDNNQIIINPNAVHNHFLGIMIFSTKAKEIVENISYKLNRENELEELINFMPKMTYLEMDTATEVSKLREKANIEKEKYKGQVED